MSDTPLTPHEAVAASPVPVEPAPAGEPVAPALSDEDVVASAFLFDELQRLAALGAQPSASIEQPSTSVEEPVNANAVFSRELTRAIDLAAHNPDGLIDVQALRTELDRSNLPPALRVQHPLMSALDQMTQSNRFQTEAAVTALFANHGVKPIQVVLPQEFIDAGLSGDKAVQKPQQVRTPAATKSEKLAERAQIAPTAEAELPEALQQMLQEQRQPPGMQRNQTGKSPAQAAGMGFSLFSRKGADNSASKGNTAFNQTSEQAKASVPDGKLDAHLCNRLLDRVEANSKALIACAEEVKSKPGPGMAHTRREIGSQMTVLMHAMAGDADLLREAGVDKMDDRLANRSEKVGKTARQAVETAKEVEDSLDPETKRKFREAMAKLMESIREMVDNLMRKVSSSFGFNR